MLGQIVLLLNQAFVVELAVVMVLAVFVCAIMVLVVAVDDVVEDAAVVVVMAVAINLVMMFCWLCHGGCHGDAG
jgi:hypothetical protein